MNLVFSAPKEWENWLDLALGVWLLLSPWLLQFGGDATAVTNSVVIGFLIIVAEVFTFSTLGALEELIDLVLGLWLVVSPWILNISSRVASADFVIVGLLVLGLAIYEIWDARRMSSA
jgi:hypothetical protein